MPSNRGAQSSAAWMVGTEAELTEHKAPFCIVPVDDAEVTAFHERVIVVAIGRATHVIPAVGVIEGNSTFLFKVVQHFLLSIGTNSFSSR